MSHKLQIVLPDPVAAQLQELAAGADQRPSTLAGQMVRNGVAGIDERVGAVNEHQDSTPAFPVVSMAVSPNTHCDVSSRGHPYWPSSVGDEVRLGLASDANRSAYEHITKKDIALRPNEPVLLAGQRIIGSLRHGPDYATRLTSETKKLWAVAFGSPGETDDELRSLASAICAAGVDFGIWTVASC